MLSLMAKRSPASGPVLRPARGCAKRSIQACGAPDPSCTMVGGPSRMLENHLVSQPPLQELRQPIAPDFSAPPVPRVPPAPYPALHPVRRGCACKMRFLPQIIKKEVCMSWQPEVDELQWRKQLAQQIGGAEKVQRHKDAGKLTVRERIEAIADPGSFQEIGALAGSGQYDADGKIAGLRPSNLAIGHAQIDARPVVLVGDDFPVGGGANGGAVGDELVHAERMAGDLRLPVVRLVDGTGGGGSVRNIETKGHTLLPEMRVWQHVVENMSLVPVVSLALGSVAGMGAARVAASHYSVMVKGLSQLFNAGPPIVAHIGQQVSKNELGGSQIHTRNGVVDDEVDTEAEAFARARRFLSYLPTSVFELPPRGAAPAASADQQWLLAAIPRDARSVYKIRPIVQTLVDPDSFMELGGKWGRALATGLARIDGWPVAALASDPYHYGGHWDRATSDKLIRFVDLAQVFHLPVVNLVDVAGFQIGVDAEKSGVMRSGVRALAAIYQTTVPWCSIIVRRAYGVAAAGHQHMGRHNWRYAWPSANWGSLPIEGGLDVAYKAEIEAAQDPGRKRAEIEQRLRNLTSPFRSAEAFVVEDIINPPDTPPPPPHIIAPAPRRPCLQRAPPPPARAARAPGRLCPSGRALAPARPASVWHPALRSACRAAVLPDSSRQQPCGSADVISRSSAPPPSRRAWAARPRWRPRRRHGQAGPSPWSCPFRRAA